MHTGEILHAYEKVVSMILSVQSELADIFILIEDYILCTSELIHDISLIFSIPTLSFKHGSALFRIMHHIFIHHKRLYLEGGNIGTAAALGFNAVNNA